MEVPDHLKEALSNIREGLHFRYNRKAVLKEPGQLAASGVLVKDPEYEPRFEIWDTDPYGKLYMVMRVQHNDGSFRFPDDRLIEHIWMLHPARYNGDVRKMVMAQIDNPETLREMGTKKDSDDLIEAIANWAEWVQTPKSGSAISYRGKRMLS